MSKSARHQEPKGKVFAAILGVVCLVVAWMYVSRGTSSGRNYLISPLPVLDDATRNAQVQLGTPAIEGMEWVSFQDNNLDISVAYPNNYLHLENDGAGVRFANATRYILALHKIATSKSPRAWWEDQIKKMTTSGISHEAYTVSDVRFHDIPALFVQEKQDDAFSVATLFVQRNGFLLEINFTSTSSKDDQFRAYDGAVIDRMLGSLVF